MIGPYSFRSTLFMFPTHVSYPELRLEILLHILYRNLCIHDISISSYSNHSYSSITVHVSNMFRTLSMFKLGVFRLMICPCHLTRSKVSVSKYWLGIPFIRHLFHMYSKIRSGARVSLFV